MKNRAGNSTKNRIIEAALCELTEVGYSAFTQEGVSKRVGISLGNLTYHFPKRTDLLSAMIESWLKEWSNGFKLDVRRNLKTEDSFVDFVEWVMKGAIEPKNVRLYRELWAMANHDFEIEIALHNLYNRAVDLTLEELGVPPDADNYESLRSVVYLLACASEGAAAVGINAAKSHANTDAIIDLAKKIFVPLLRQAVEKSAE
jgi:AcrR family transcriptional regulator